MKQTLEVVEDLLGDLQGDAGVDQAQAEGMLPEEWELLVRTKLGELLQ